MLLPGIALVDSQFSTPKFPRNPSIIRDWIVTRGKIYPRVIFQSRITFDKGKDAIFSAVPLLFCNWKIHSRIDFSRVIYQSRITEDTCAKNTSGSGHYSCDTIRDGIFYSQKSDGIAEKIAPFPLSEVISDWNITRGYIFPRLNIQSRKMVWLPGNFGVENNESTRVFPSHNISATDISVANNCRKIAGK